MADVFRNCYFATLLRLLYTQYIPESLSNVFWIEKIFENLHKKIVTFVFIDIRSVILSIFYEKIESLSIKKSPGSDLNYNEFLLHNFICFYWSNRWFIKLKQFFSTYFRRLFAYFANIYYMKFRIVLDWQPLVFLRMFCTNNIL